MRAVVPDLIKRVIAVLPIRNTQKRQGKLTRNDARTFAQLVIRHGLASGMSEKGVVAVQFDGGQSSRFSAAEWHGSIRIAPHPAIR